MNASTKIKLIIPVIYAALSIAFFVFSWPAFIMTQHFLGVTITLTAFTFWLVARVQLGNSFSIAPKANGLVQSGIYSKLRHPVYYFSILAVAGLVIYVWSPLGMLPLIALVLLEIYRIRKEEAVLTQNYGNEYLVYKSKTWF